MSIQYWDMLDSELDRTYRGPDGTEHIFLRNLESVDPCSIALVARGYILHSYKGFLR